MGTGFGGEAGEEGEERLSDSGSKLCRYRTYIYPAKYGLILIVTVTMGFQFLTVNKYYMHQTASGHEFRFVC